MACHKPTGARSLVWTEYRLRRVHEHREHYMVSTDPDEPLVDTTLAAEIALLGEVMAVAAAAGPTLTQAEVDAALGLAAPEHGGSGAARQA